MTRHRVDSPSVRRRHTALRLRTDSSSTGAHIGTSPRPVQSGHQGRSRSLGEPMELPVGPPLGCQFGHRPAARRAPSTRFAPPAGPSRRRPQLLITSRAPRPRFRRPVDQDHLEPSLGLRSRQAPLPYRLKGRQLLCRLLMSIAMPASVGLHWCDMDPGQMVRARPTRRRPLGWFISTCGCSDLRRLGMRR